MKNRILAVVVICLVIVSFSLNVFSANEINNEENVNNITDNNTIENKTLEQQQEEVRSKIDDSNNQLQYVQSELSENLQKVEELEDSVNKYQSQCSDLESQISSLQTKLDETNSKLTEVQDTYNRKEKILKKRVVALYEAGDSSYIDLFLSSESITEFISNYFLVSELVQYDSDLLDGLEDTENQIQSTKERQEAQQNELKVKKQDINETRILMENTQTVKENYMAKLTDQEKALQGQIAQYKSQQVEIESQILAAMNWTGAMSIQFTGGAMIWPIAMNGTYITSGFGMRLHPIQGVYKNHDGLDISGANVYDAPIVAAADGVVTYAGVMSGYGNCVIINHGSGIATLYGHGSEIVTQLGATVKQGDIIMKVGSTGNSTGPHVHFEVRKDGVAVDPTPYLNGTITNINQTDNNTINSEANIIINN